MEITKKTEDDIIKIILEQLCLYEYRITDNKLITNKYEKFYGKPERILYDKLVNEYELIERKEKTNGYYKLTEKGSEVKEICSWIEYNNKKNEELKFNKEREILEFKKSKVDFELAEKMLKEFPKTKLFARIGLAIGVLLLLKELYITICK